MPFGKHRADPPPLPYVHKPVRAHHRSQHVLLQTGCIILLLTVWLFTELLSGWPVTPPVAHAATSTPFATAPGKFTLRKFLQQGQPDKRKHGVFGIPAAALAQAHLHASKIKASSSTPPLPSAEPATMQSLTAPLDSSFLTQGTQMPVAATPTPTATSPPTVTPTATRVTTPTVTPTATRVTTPTVPATPTPRAAASPVAFNSSLSPFKSLLATPTATPNTISGTVTPTPVPTTTPTAVPTTISATPATTTSTAPLVLKGSDGRLEVDVPRGSLNFSAATLLGGGTPVAPLTLQITELSGHSIGSSNLLGRYLLLVVDSSGKPLQGVTLSQPLTLRYHYQKGELSGLNLNPNNIFLSYPGMIPLVTSGTPAPTGNLVVPFTNNPATLTLTAQTTVLGVPAPGATGFKAVSFTAQTAATQTASSAAATVGGPSTFVPPPTPLLATVQGNAGQLSYDYPLSVPAGPGGFQPELKLSYSSQDTNGRHDPRSPADSTGDGWSLPLPSISQSWFGESSAGDGQFYYTLSDVDHVSDRLAEADSSSPHVKFVTEHVSHLRIRLDNTDNSNGASSCFHVWGLDGTYYEIGCTIDSSQCAIDSNGNCSEYLYNVNKIVAPYDSTGHVRMMLLTYNEDMTGSGSNQTVRDSVIRQIRYGIADSPTASSLTTTVGTVDFLYHGVSSDSSNGIDWVKAYGNNYNCSSSPDSTTTLRCDDTEKVNSDAAPSVMSTFELDSVISYVGTDDSSSHKAYQYSFKYKDSPGSSSYQDPITHDTEGSAGQHLLTSVTPTIFQNGTAHQRNGLSFGYTSLRNTYYDSWNPPNTSYAYQIATRWPYLTSYRDLDTGAAGTATYQTAENNTHGTPYVVNSDGSVDDRHDPFYCSVHANDSSSSTQCSGNYDHPDERAWSEQVVTQTQDLGVDSAIITPFTTTYKYLLGVVDSSHTSTGCNPISVSSPPGQSDCVADTWVPKALGGSTDLDWQDYFHGDFVGFNTVYTTDPAGNLTVDSYYTTEGWGTYASDAANYNSGQLYQSDTYQGGASVDSALLRRTTNTLTGENGTATGCDTSIEKLYSPCLQMTVSTRTTDYEGTGSSNTNAPWVQTDSTYDDYSPSSGFNNSSTVYHELLTQATSSSNAPTVTQKMSYQVNDQTSNSVVYYHLVPTHSELDDSSGHVWQCQDTAYDEGSSLPAPSGGWATTTTTYSNCADQADTAIKTYTAYDATGNVLASVDGFGANNSAPYHSNGCQTPFLPTALSGSWTLGRYTSCTTYDGNGALPLSTANVYNQNTATTYDATQGNLPTSTTDVNSQKTMLSYSYDSNGDPTIQVLLPNGTSSYTTKSSAVSNCSSSSTLPCYEIDKSSAQYAGAITRTFYDGMGRAVQTRTPLDASHDTVTFTVYDHGGSYTFVSQPFRVAAGSNWLDPNTATDDSGATPAGTSTYMDALGRVIATQDPLLGSSSEPGISCAGLSGTWTSCVSYGLGTVSGDNNTYTMATSIDANNHVQASYTDALNTDKTPRVRYVLTYSGISGGTLTANAQTATQYNALNKPTTVTVTDLAPQSGQSITSVTTTASYDDLGRITTLSDPDRGTHTYTYDADGRQLTDVSSTRTIGTSYDLLGRSICVQDAAPTTDGSGSCSNGSHPLLQNTYDQSQLGTAGTNDFPVGQLTQSVATTYYSDGSATTTTEQFQHDQRGHVVTSTLQIGVPSSWNVSTALPTYQETQAYNDDDQSTTTQTTIGGQAGYTFTQVYDSTTGMLTGLSNNAVGSANLATLNYDIQGNVSDINFLAPSGSSTVALANDHFTFDGDMRPASTVATWQSGSGSTGTIFSINRGYDAVGNVFGVATQEASLSGASNSGGSEVQNFCYDEQNRLVWAGNSGTQPAAGNGTCGNVALSNTFGGNAYNTSFASTHLGQLWQGPISGSGNSLQYLYCDTQHPHQLTGVYPMGTSCSSLTGTNYYASYDAWGNMVTRAANDVTSTLSFDSLDHLTQWSASSSDQSQDAYDASGSRVLQRSTTSAGTTMTVYAFGLEEHVYDGSGNHQSDTFYYSLNSHLLGALTSTGTQFFLADALGSVLSTISDVANTAAVLGNQLYGPYGNLRYNAGTMGTQKGFTGQYADSLSGLDYYNARYYDPVVGRFISADTVQDDLQGADPYAYVGDNPETKNDPTGHCWPFCTVLVGAIAGAVIGTAVSTAAQVVSNVVQHKAVTDGLAEAAVGGLVSGAITGAVAGTGVGLGLAATIAVGAASGAAGGVASKAVGNAIAGKNLGDGLLQAGITGGITGGITAGVLKVASQPLQNLAGKAVDAIRNTLGSDIGNFADIAGANPTYGQIRMRVPTNAVQESFRTNAAIPDGDVKYTWSDSASNRTTVYAHGVNAGAPPGSNSSMGWTWRMTASPGNFLATDGTVWPNSNYANETHLPMQTPTRGWFGYWY